MKAWETVKKARAGEYPKSYTPKMQAAMSVYFGAALNGEKIKIKDLAQATGLSYNVLRHYIRGVRTQIEKMIREAP